MKNRTVRTMITVLATALLVGCNSMTAGEQTETRADNRTDNRITETTNNMNKWDNTEVYFTRTKEDYNKMTDILENRNGKIIIKVIETTVLNNEGNASDAFGFYVKYESGKYRKEIKEIGFKWGSQKKAWYWHSEEYIKKSHRNLSMDEIRNYYGSTEVETEGRKGSQLYTEY